MNQDQILRRLIDPGYFPRELPPPFTTSTYSEHAIELAAKWNLSKPNRFRSKPEKYSLPQVGHTRRVLSIPNPINHLHVAHLIATNWQIIEDRINQSRIADSRLSFDRHDRYGSLGRTDFKSVHRRRLQILANYGRYIKTDIARFYPSIYTHSITWALLGKDFVKDPANRDHVKEHFSALLDRAVAAGQEGQTIGIPIGPDTSRILAELVACGFEQILASEIPDLPDRAVRYVDDMIIGLKDDELAAAVLSPLTNALLVYELGLNAEKTSVHGAGFPHPLEWLHLIRTHDARQRPTWRQDDLDSYFTQAIHLAECQPRENVLLFATKRAINFQTKEVDKPHLIRWLLYAARLNATCLSPVIHYLSGLPEDKSLTKSEIQNFILSQVNKHINSLHTHEVSWLLYWALKNRLTIPREISQRLTHWPSSVIALLTLDLRRDGLVPIETDDSFWREGATPKGLKSDLWLVGYEATRKEWWRPSINTKFIVNTPFFSDLLGKQIEFYDAEARLYLRPRRKNRQRPVQFHYAYSTD